MQLPTTLRTVEHYQQIADKFEELAATLERRNFRGEGMPDRLKHLAREIRENIHFGSLLRH